jgi:hypothetical protein
MKVVKSLLYYLLLVNSMAGIWALFFPHEFYTSFPGSGFHWVDIMGPYSEHLIRDVGAFYCAVASLSLFTLLKFDRTAVKLTAYANIVFGVPHLIYHIYMIDMFPTPKDKFFGILALSLSVVTAAIMLVFVKKIPVNNPN